MCYWNNQLYPRKNEWNLPCLFYSEEHSEQAYENAQLTAAGKDSDTSKSDSDHFSLRMGACFQMANCSGQKWEAEIDWLGCAAEDL
jgi:hypothetical protein